MFQSEFYCELQSIYKGEEKSKRISVGLSLLKLNINPQQLKMKLIFIALCFTYFCPILGQKFPIQTKIKFVKDLLVNEDIPSTLVIRACWSHQETAAFSRNVGYSTLFQYERFSVEQIFESNAIWFFVDMNCSFSLNVLNTVN